MIDFYELLGIKKSASKDEIKLAYRNLVKKYHPDVNSNADSKIIRNLNEAKEILLDDDKRREYDLSLMNVNKSKEFSKDEKETYSYKSEVHKNKYYETYVTRMEFFKSYFRNSLDKKYKKILKSILVGINYLIFFIVRSICYVFIYTCFIMQEFVDFIAFLFGLFAILSLFGLDASEGFFSFIPLNVERFCVFIFFAILILVIKTFILTGYVNIFRFIQKLHDRLFLFILNRL